MNIEGRAWRFGDDIDTDVIIPARYLVTDNAVELGKHCMEDADADFVNKIASGDVIVGGENFGCGSSREHAPLAIKGAGISCVVAASFARIFFRNALNVGLPIVVSPEAAASIEEGDVVVVDARAGTVQNRTKGVTFSVAPFPPSLQELVEAGGLAPFVRRRLEEKKKEEVRR